MGAVGTEGMADAMIESSADCKLKPTMFLASILNLYVFPAVVGVRVKEVPAIPDAKST